MRWGGAPVLPAGKHCLFSEVCQALTAKRFHFTEFRNCRMFRSLRPNGEGRIAIVTTCGPDGGGRGQHWREGSRRAGHSVSERSAQTTGVVRVRQNCVVLT